MTQSVMVVENVCSRVLSATFVCATYTTNNGGKEEEEGQKRRCRAGCRSVVTGVCRGGVWGMCVWVLARKKEGERLRIGVCIMCRLLHCQINQPKLVSYRSMCFCRFSCFGGCQLRFHACNHVVKLAALSVAAPH